MIFIKIIKNVIFFYILKTDVTKNPYRLDKLSNLFCQFINQIHIVAFVGFK